MAYLAAFFLPQRSTARAAWRCIVASGSQALLVGGWAIPLKNMKVNGKDDNPYIMEDKACSKPPTRLVLPIYNLYVLHTLYIRISANKTDLVQHIPLRNPQISGQKNLLCSETKWKCHGDPWLSGKWSTSMMDFPYCGWLRNPAPPKGWLKPIQNNGMFTTVFNWW